MTDNLEGRLDRIEDKMDKMAEALVTLARFEEKMDAYNEYRERSWERMNRFSEKLDIIEKKVEDNCRTVHTINKLFWIGLIAISGSIAAQLWM